MRLSGIDNTCEKDSLIINIVITFSKNKYISGGVKYFKIFERCDVGAIGAFALSALRVSATKKCTVALSDNSYVDVQTGVECTTYGLDIH